MRLFPLPDDHGCFDARSAILRSRLYPLNYSDVSEKQIEGWLAELIAVDCIRVWAESGVRYGLIPSWDKHQQIRSLHHRKTPVPPAEITILQTTVSKVDNNCDQPPTPAALNPNLNPNLNPVPLKPPEGAAGVAESDFEIRWLKYPNRDGRKAALRHFNASVRTAEALVELDLALANYVETRTRENEIRKSRKQEPIPWKNGSTWFNNWRDWIPKKPPNYQPTSREQTQNRLRELITVPMEAHA
jgi:hypothetical protein